ncbi:hypothetical protein [Polyangium aurulentum]|uniref:hypothetical protein n=1 Tax=Polyangium aurulentum TaxID=2567896 RepID=UPI0010AE191B|nr:hypothetical protein [Polyangium aurulentum]UQA60643.1 hypothetical protein E8A73_009270 [Polyangium aurulentum]
MRIEFGMTIPMDLDGEADQYIVHYWGQILDSADPEDAGAESAEVIVGRVDASRVHMGLVTEHGESVVEVFDAHSDDIVEFCEALFDVDTEELKDDISEQTSGADLLLIESIEILPQYRGKGLGLKVLRRLMEFLGGGCALAAIKARPVRYTDPADADWSRRMQPDLLEASPDAVPQRLREYFSRLGFERVGDTDIMAFDLAYEIPALPEDDGDDDDDEDENA